MNDDKSPRCRPALAVNEAQLADEWTANDGNVYMVDTRLETTLRLGFYPNEEVVTPAGLAWVIGVDIHGSLLFEIVRNSEPVLYAYKCKAAFEKAGFHVVRTTREKKFVSIAVDWTSESGAVFTLVTRADLLLDLGLVRHQLAITPAGLATVIGFDIQGKILFELIDQSEATAPVLYGSAADDRFWHPAVHPIRTEADKAFLAIATQWVMCDDEDSEEEEAEAGDGEEEQEEQEEDADEDDGEDSNDNTGDKANKKRVKKPIIFFYDRRPDAARAFGLIPNDQLVTNHGLATVMGTLIDGGLLLKIKRNARAMLCPSAEQYDKARFHVIRSLQEKTFAAVAVDVPVKEKGRTVTVSTVDIRPEALLAFGLSPNERFITPFGVATVIGVNITGRLIFTIFSNDKCVTYPISRDEFSRRREEFHLSRNEKERRFMAAAVNWTSDGEGILVVDTRPEALVAFGLSPNERFITPFGVATVIGVNMGGKLLVLIFRNGESITYPISREDFSRRRQEFHISRNDEERRFMAEAVNWTPVDGPHKGFTPLNTRPEALRARGFLPNERIMTPFYGFATVVGVDIDGKILLLEEHRTKRPILCSAEGTVEGLIKDCYFPIRTEKHRQFAAVAVEWMLKNGKIFLLDTRPKSLRPFGFVPNEPVITPRGIAMVLGLDIDGLLQTEVIASAEPIAYPSAPKEDFEKGGFRPIRTDAEKAFAAVAVNWTAKGGDPTAIHVLDTRPAALMALGFRRNDQMSVPGGRATVVGVDVDGRLAVEAIHEKGLVYFVHVAGATAAHLKNNNKNEIKNNNNNNNKLENHTKRTDAVPAPKSSAQSLNNAPSLPAMRTVTLPSGAVYRGAHTRAGQRHGNGTMRSADRSWRYKGQWQQGRPHGSGTLRMTVGLTEAVYEGRWVLGVPHGRGTLCVESVSERRRYRGRWAHGRRAMTSVEVAAVRLSGGTALVCCRPPPSVPPMVDVSKKNQKKKAVPAAPARPSPTVAVFATHDEVQRMVAAVAAACAYSTVTATGGKQLRPPASDALHPPRLVVDPEDTATRTRKTHALRQFLLR